MELELFELMKKQEPLCEELARRVRPVGAVAGMNMVHHPLIVDLPYFPQMNAVLNKRLQAKKDLVESYLEKGKFDAALYVYERPYRAEMLVQMMDDYPLDRKTIARLVLGCWTDSENIWEMGDVWDYLWGDQWDLNPSDFDMMVAEKKLYAAHQKSGEPITVYRGYGQGSHEEQSLARSWTTCPDQAQWFADRFSGGGGTEPVVLKGQVRLKYVHAINFGRGEREIITHRGGVECIERVGV